MEAQINDVSNSYEEAQDAVANTRTAIITVRSFEKSWSDRLGQIEKLSLKTMTNALESSDFEEFDKLTSETTLIERRLELVPRLLQHLSELEKEGLAKLDAERAKLTQAESKTTYLKLRDELVANPHILTNGEEQTLRIAAVQGGYRDELDTLLPAIDLYLQHVKHGVANGPFVWADCPQNINHGY